MGKRSYDFTPAIERLIAYYSATDRSFWARFGCAVESECFVDLRVRLILDACRAIQVETKQGPASLVRVVQRIRRWVGEGKVTYEDLVAASDYMDSVDESTASIEDVFEEALPIVRRRMEREALEAAFEEHSKRGDFAAAMRSLERVQRLGAAPQIAGGVGLNAAAMDRLGELNLSDKLPTGILELDDALEGGMRRGVTGVVIGDTNVGKSVYVIQTAAAALFRGKNVCYATLEVEAEILFARLLANFTGIPYLDIVDDSKKQVAASRSALEKVSQMEGLGQIQIEHFPSGTELGDIFVWVGQVEDLIKAKVDLLVLDYMDLVGDQASKGDGYKHGKNVTEKLCDWTQSRQGWTWTLSQAGRPKDQESKKGGDGRKVKAPGLHNVSDSYHKVRRPKLVISLFQADAEGIGYVVLKNTMGPKGMVIQPLKADLTCSRICPVIWRKRDDPVPTVEDVMQQARMF